MPVASIYDLKPRFQTSLRPAVRYLARAGVSANQVTVTAVILSVAMGAIVILGPTARWPLLLMPVVLFARMALNAVDGMLAREHDMQSNLGIFLNELGDVVSDAVLYLPFALLPGVSAPLVVIAVVIGIVVEIAGMAAVQAGIARRYDGPMGKSDRAAAFGLAALLLGLNLGPVSVVNGILGLVAFLGVLTIVRRVRNVLARTG